MTVTHRDRTLPCRHIKKARQRHENLQYLQSEPHIEKKFCGYPSPHTIHNNLWSKDTLILIHIKHVKQIRYNVLSF